MDRRVARQRRSTRLVHRRGCYLAVVHRALRQSRGSARGRPQQGAGLGVARHAPERLGQALEGAAQRQRFLDPARRGPASRQCRAGRSRRSHALRRRGDRRRRVRGRIGHHRGIRPRHPRIRRRFFRGHRRHARTFRLDRRALHGRSGRDLPRSHDRHGRKREAAQDAERDRARDPARRADARVPARHRHAAAVFALQREGRQCRRAGLDHRAGRAAGLPDSDHDRRAAVGHRRGGHEPHARRECPRDVGARGRGGGRRRRPAARQDGHDYARQSAGEHLRAGARRDSARSRRRGAARLARGRDAGGTQRRRTRENGVRLPRTQHRRAGGDLRAVFRDHPHERRQRRRAADPQGRRRRDQASRAGTRRRVSRRSRACSRGRRAPRQHPAGRRRWRPRARRDRVEGRRQGRDQGAFRRVAAHGDQDGDDHRRQPPHRRRDRRRGRRRRLPRRGDTGSEARADSAPSGGGPPGRDDGRRHQRRARRSRRPTSPSRWEPARRPPRKPGTWSTSTATRPS